VRIITGSMKQSTSLEARSHSASQDIPRLLWNMKAGSLPCSQEPNMSASQNTRYMNIALLYVIVRGLRTRSEVGITLDLREQVVRIDATQDCIQWR